ncbi:hypothetical protein FNU76_00905 [Chitinimonas arctica]|uniref:Uncharacterized protein n=1 Tax=Chitinimonas arctica TaxID=2594795 RepID=A0A516SA37_9NEIS|nr:hypothetical protein [Chitinimonas arctica]QDQ25021.1 hypothetical protein FNU76_00905 [Chitinimonas arctica]
MKMRNYFKSGWRRFSIFALVTSSIVSQSASLETPVYEARIDTVVSGVYTSRGSTVGAACGGLSIPSRTESTPRVGECNALNMTGAAFLSTYATRVTPADKVTGLQGCIVIETITATSKGCMDEMPEPGKAEWGVSISTVCENEFLELIPLPKGGYICAARAQPLPPKDPLGEWADPPEDCSPLGE